MIAGGSALSKLFEDNPSLSVKELVGGVGLAVATYALRYVDDIPPEQVEAVVRMTIARWFPDKADSMPPPEANGTP